MKEFNNDNLIKYNFSMKPVKLFDSFAGIGALHQSLKELGAPVELTGISEIDVEAIISYVAVHKIDISKIEPLEIQEMKDYLINRNIGYDFKKNKTSIPRMKKDKLELLYKCCIATNNLGDISLINPDAIPNFDLFNMSFPCTDLSIAGKQQGMIDKEGNKTRSGLYVEGVKIIKHKKPKYIMIENVKNLIGKKFINDFYSIINEIEGHGYKCYYPKKENRQPICLNAKDYGIPQNRERIYVICIRNDVDDKNFNFPKGFDSGLRLKDLLEDKVNEKYYLKETKNFFIKNYFDMENKGNGFRFEPFVRTKADIAKTVTTRAGSRMDDNFIMDNNIDDYDKPKFKFDSKNKYLSSLIESKNELNIIGTTKSEDRNIGQRDRTYGINGIVPTLSETDYKQPKQILESNKIIKLDIPQIVKLRKYPVDIEKLKTILKDSKKAIGLSNKQVSGILHQPLTKVEHWFRSDKCFSIPDSEIWQELKEILNITTDEFDKSITTFIEVEGNFEKANRVYLTNGIAPTITTLDGEKILEINKENKNSLNKLRKFGILSEYFNLQGTIFLMLSNGIFF